MSVTSQNVLDTPNKNTIFMVWNFSQTQNLSQVFATVCKLVLNLNNSAQTRFPNTGSSVVLAVGYNAWKTLGLGEKMPKEFEEFQPIVGQKHTAVATAGDLHFHIRGAEYSFCIDTAAAISQVLSPVAVCTEEVHGFRYWDGRSILGFVDGTENPQGQARQYFGVISQEDDPDFAGGSYLFVQKYLHNMQAWDALPTSEQEKVIGRSKTEDIEMSDQQKPSNSHSALANVGDDKKIVRDNMPFGNVAKGEMGTYFIAYASHFSTVKQMLGRMFVGDPVGNYDRILDFSTPKTGTLFFAPSLDLLSDWAG